MVRFFITLTVAAATISAVDIVVSKDSLRVSNDVTTTTGWDSLTIFNNGVQQVSLDSARILISEWAPKFPSQSMNRAQGMVSESSPDVRTLHYFTLDSIGTEEFCCVFPASSSPRFTIGPSGGSTILGTMELGWNFFGAIPAYPDFMKGVLSLYFSNGEVLSLHLFSNDLRTATADFHRTVFTREGTSRIPSKFLINGQMITGKTESYIRGHRVHRLITRK